jgi:FkbM family methyltransferase
VIVDTRRVFLKLLRTFEIDTVCDVGSLDGSDALQFRRVLPTAEVIAFEPNPRNFELMATDDRLPRHKIRILPFAVSDRDAEAPFFVVGARYERNLDVQRRGISSLHRRADSSLIAEVVQVRTVRLDDVLAKGSTAGGVALWIDTEGMGFEAIAGASGVLARTRMLHVEAETVPCIGAEQKVLSDIERILDADFELLATDHPRDWSQLNALFVGKESLRAHAAEIRAHLTNERLRHRVKAAVRPLVPRRLRRFLSRHTHAVRR